MSHSYSVLSAFTIYDPFGSKHDLIMLRNPWGMTSYNGTWNSKDLSWDDYMVS